MCVARNLQGGKRVNSMLWYGLVWSGRVASFASKTLILNVSGLSPAAVLAANPESPTHCAGQQPPTHCAEQYARRLGWDAGSIVVLSEQCKVHAANPESPTHCAGQYARRLGWDAGSIVVLSEQCKVHAANPESPTHCAVQHSRRLGWDAGSIVVLSEQCKESAYVRSDYQLSTFYYYLRFLALLDLSRAPYVLYRV